MSNKDTKVLEVANFLTKNPKATGKVVAKKFKIALSYAYVLMSKARAIKKEADEVVEEANADNEKISNLAYKITLGRGELRPKLRLLEVEQERERLEAVNHPPHYKVGGIETIDFIEAKGLGYHLGNVVKYISRADQKGDKLENLEKAQWYLNRAIDNLRK
jgi:hypothetical protein